MLAGTLASRCRQYLWMAVPLIDSRVGGQEVIVLLAVNIPHMHTLSSAQNHGHGRIIVGAISVLSLYVLQGAGSALYQVHINTLSARLAHNSQYKKLPS